MKTLLRLTEDRNGSALITVMGVILVVAIVAGSMMALSRTQAYTAMRTSDYLRAKLIAESGANSAYNQIRTNFALAGQASPFPAVNYGGGRYDTDVRLVASNRALILCSGFYGSATAQAMIDVVNIPVVTTNGTVPLTTCWGFAMFANGYTRLNGASFFSGAVHANNYIDVNGTLAWGAPTNLVWVEACGAKGFEASGGGEIYGTVRAPYIGFAGTLTDRRVQDVPTYPIPKIDLSKYYATAVANGQVYGTTTISANQNWGTIPGGVRWFNGDLTIKNNGVITYTGCIIATGQIIVQGGCNCDRYGTAPSLISRDSTITFNGTQNTRGLIYANGDITFNGSGTHQGTILSNGNIVFGGSATVQTTFMYCEPDQVIPTNRVMDRVYVTAWQD